MLKGAPKRPPFGAPGEYVAAPPWVQPPIPGGGLNAMLVDPSLRKTEPRDPDVDGYVLPEQSALVFQAGCEAATPLIVGATARDGDFANMGVSGKASLRTAACDLFARKTELDLNALKAGHAGRPVVTASEVVATSEVKAACRNAGGSIVLWRMWRRGRRGRLEDGGE